MVSLQIKGFLKCLGVLQASTVSAVSFLKQISSQETWYLWFSSLANDSLGILEQLLNDREIGVSKKKWSGIGCRGCLFPQWPFWQGASFKLFVGGCLETKSEWETIVGWRFEFPNLEIYKVFSCATSQPVPDAICDCGCQKIPAVRIRNVNPIESLWLMYLTASLGKHKTMSMQKLGTAKNGTSCLCLHVKMGNLWKVALYTTI